MAILEVLEFFDPSGEIIVIKRPEMGSGEFKLGSQLVVQESQLAIFYKDGRALDMFEPGRHTLSTMNLPFLGKIIGAPFGQSPFRCYVYFVSTKTFTGMGWGTGTPVNFRDSELRMIQLRAHGSFAIRIIQPRTFLQTIIGTMGKETTYQIEEYIRAFIISKLNVNLAKQLDTIFDLPLHYETIALNTKQDVREDLLQYGIELVDLIVEAITPPPEVQERIDQASGLAAQDTDKYRDIGTIDALKDAAKNPSGTAGEGIGAGLGLGMGMTMAQNFMAGMPKDNPQQPTPPPNPEEKIDVTAELIKAKEWFESGLITEEEYNLKRQELLKL
jgi:membrane protease subunit (stomatin/prohibitin family)